eukprot:jgi/Tetstr1/430209/TSEL_020038.t1
MCPCRFRGMGTQLVHRHHRAAAHVVPGCFRSSATQLLGAIGPPLNVAGCFRSPGTVDHLPLHHQHDQRHGQCREQPSRPRVCGVAVRGGRRADAPLPVRSTVETFSECLKAQHGLGVVDDLVNITKTQYELTTAAATDAASALAQDLEYLTSGAGKAKSGVDVRGVDVFFEQRWASATSHAFRLDTFAMFDGTLSIKNGQCSVTK